MKVWIVMANRWDGDEGSDKGRDSVFAVCSSEAKANQVCAEVSAKPRGWDSARFYVDDAVEVQS